MQPTLEQISRYFSNTLDDELQTYTEYKDNQAVYLSPEELERGDVTSKEIRKLAPKGNTSATSFQIVIAPVCYRKIESQKGATNAPEKIVPLMVPCWFNTKNNRLTAIEGVTPWFVREHLEPQVTDHP